MTLVAHLVAAAALAAAPADTAALRRALETANAALLAAVVRGDAEAAAAAYAADAHLLPPDGTVVRGRDAIRAFWAAGAGTEIVRAATTTLAAGGDGDVAYLAGTYELATRPRATPTAEPAIARGTFLLVFRRERGRWLVVQDGWSG